MGEVLWPMMDKKSDYLSMMVSSGLNVYQLLNKRNKVSQKSGYWEQLPYMQIKAAYEIMMT